MIPKFPQCRDFVGLALVCALQVCAGDRAYLLPAVVGGAVMVALW